MVGQAFCDVGPKTVQGGTGEFRRSGDAAVERASEHLAVYGHNEDVLVGQAEEGLVHLDAGHGG